MILMSGKKTIASRVETASSFASRFFGLLGRTDLPAGYAMLFPRCNSIHTFFMKIPIDVIMYDVQGRVVFARTVGPWRIAVDLRASDTVEMKAGSVKGAGLKPGDTVKVRTVKVKGKSQKL